MTMSEKYEGCLRVSKVYNDCMRISGMYYKRIEEYSESVQGYMNVS